jgi:hypothetical protein
LQEPQTKKTKTKTKTKKKQKQKKQTNKLHGLSPRANYTDRATAVQEPQLKEF